MPTTQLMEVKIASVQKRDGGVHDARIRQLVRALKEAGLLWQGPPYCLFHLHMRESPRRPWTFTKTCSSGAVRL